METPVRTSAATQPPVTIDSIDGEDAVLVRRILAGDAQAARLLYDRYVEHVYRCAKRILRDDFLAQDATQEAFLRAFKRLDVYRGDAPLRAWLIAIAVSCAYDEVRRRGSAVRMSEVPIDAVGDIGAAAAEPEPILRDRLREAINALPEGQRDVVTMFAIEGYGHNEIAAALDIPVATSKTRLFQARATLRKALGAYAPGSDT